jgi:hypothetical protein
MAASRSTFRLWASGNLSQPIPELIQNDRARLLLTQQVRRALDLKLYPIVMPLGLFSIKRFIVSHRRRFADQLNNHQNFDPPLPGSSFSRW